MPALPTINLLLMKPTFYLLLLAALLGYTNGDVSAQSRYFTRSGHIWFFSEAPLEDIEAHNKQVISFIDFKSGEMVFSVPMKAFQFRKSLMQKHFNESYVESDKYPKATFAGKFSNSSAIDLKQDGSYNVQVTGLLTIHGVEKPVSTTGTLEVRKGSVLGNAVFIVAPEDYDISIPLLVRGHIAKEITIHVEMRYQPYKENSP